MEKNNTEQQIIEAAKQVFIEKGFAESSMSDIAARAGINRPALHYYFRTKEKMFEAVFAELLCSFVPSVQEAIQQDAPLAERIAKVVDIYAEMLRHNPQLPLFAVKEIKRDVGHILSTAKNIESIRQMAILVGKTLRKEMEAGHVRQMPLEHVFYTFYGLLFIPFLTRPFVEQMFPDPSELDARFDLWKAQVVRQLTCLFEPEK